MLKLTPLQRALLFYGADLPDHPRKWWLHEKLRQWMGVAVEGEMQVVRSGLCWSLKPSDYEHAGLFWLGAKDAWELHHLRSILGKGSVFFDIGANFGYYALTLAAHLDRDCRIYAFEPNPTTYARLCGHVEENRLDNVIATQRLALSDAIGTGNLIERSDNSGAARLGDDREGTTIERTTLDAFCGSHAINRVDAAKIMVEGHEVRVLSGGRSTLNRFKPALLVQFWAPALERAGTSAEELAQILRSLGYELFRLSRKQLVPLSVVPRGTDHVNVFCFHHARPFPRLEAGR
jgi:FkbM family methyltransferase